MAKEEPGTYPSWSPSDNLVNPSRVVNLSSAMDSGVLRELLVDAADVADWSSPFSDYGLTNPGFFDASRAASHTVPAPWNVPPQSYVTSSSGDVLTQGASPMVSNTASMMRNSAGMADVSRAGTVTESKSDGQSEAFGWGGPYFREQRSGSATVGGMVSSPTSSGAGSGGEGREAQGRPGGLKGARNVKGTLSTCDTDREGRNGGNRSQDTQRRYRERQKAKTQDLMTKVNHLTEVNLQLQDENKRLQAENRTLYSFLHGRAPQTQNPQQFSQSQGQRQQMMQQQQQQQQSQTNSNSQAHPPNQNGRHALDGDSLADALAESLTLTVQDPPIRLSSDQLKILSHPDLTVLWKEYVNTLARLLVTVDPVRGPPAGLLDRIDQLTQEALALLTQVSFPNPRGVKTFVASKLEDEVVSRDEGSEWWLEAVDKLRLSPDQKGLAARLRVGYLEKLDQVLQTRDEVFTRLLRAQPSRLSTRITAANYLTADGVLCQLRESMNMENELVCDFITKFYQLLTPIQRAQYVVQAWPWTPDHLAFCTAVAAQLGDKDAHGLLTGAINRNRDPTALLLAHRPSEANSNMPEG